MGIVEIGKIERDAAIRAQIVHCEKGMETYPWLHDAWQREIARLEQLRQEASDGKTAE